MTTLRFDRVIAAIDAANAHDPRRTETGRPFELDYAERLTDRVERLEPQASEFLRIAARGQHIERWTSPRDTQPRDRGGYLRWREALKRFHADRVAALMRDHGYQDKDVERVVRLITKTAHREGDPEGVTLEDALCLLFFETPWATLRAKLPGSKLENALRKTWGKMSARGRSRVADLPLSPEGRSWINTLLKESTHGRF